MNRYTDLVITVARRLGPHAARALERAGCATPQDIARLPLPRQAALWRTLERIETWRSKQAILAAEAKARGLCTPKERTV